MANFYGQYVGFGAGVSGAGGFAFGGENYGFVCGNQAGNNINRFSFASGTQSGEDWDDMTGSGRYTRSGHSDKANTYSYSSGGYGPLINEIGRFSMVSSGTSNDVGDLTQVTSGAASATNATHCYSIGQEYTAGAGGDGIVVIRYVEDSFTSSSVSPLTLVSNSTTAQSAPTKGDLVFTYTNGAGTAVLGTNITAEYSADNGSTWTNFSIGASDSQGTIGGQTIVTKHDVALTSTSGTSMVYRIKTLVQSAAMETRIHAVSLGWS